MDTGSRAFRNAVILTAMATVISGTVIVVAVYLLIIGGERLIEATGLLPMLLGGVDGGSPVPAYGKLEIFAVVVLAVPLLLAIARRTFRLVLMSERLIEGPVDWSLSSTPYATDAGSYGARNRGVIQLQDAMPRQLHMNIVNTARWQSPPHATHSRPLDPGATRDGTSERSPSGARVPSRHDAPSGSGGTTR